MKQVDRFPKRYRYLQYTPNNPSRNTNVYLTRQCTRAHSGSRTKTGTRTQRVISLSVHTRGSLQSDSHPPALQNPLARRSTAVSRETHSTSSSTTVNHQTIRNNRTRHISNLQLINLQLSNLQLNNLQLSTLPTTTIPTRRRSPDIITSPVRMRTSHSTKIDHNTKSAIRMNLQRINLHKKQNQRNNPPATNMSDNPNTCQLDTLTGINQNPSHRTPPNLQTKSISQVSQLITSQSAQLNSLTTHSRHRRKRPSSTHLLISTLLNPTRSPTNITRTISHIILHGPLKSRDQRLNRPPIKQQRLLQYGRDRKFVNRHEYNNDRGPHDRRPQHRHDDGGV